MQPKQTRSAASSLLYPEIDVGVGSNATYTREDWLEVLARIAFDNEFANAGQKPTNLLAVMMLRSKLTHRIHWHEPCCTTYAISKRTASTNSSLPSATRC